MSRAISLFYSLLTRIWDPDYTKVTKKEKDAIEKARNEIKAGEYFTSEEVFSIMRR